MNYAAFNDELLNAEIYGHEKGAFTGACQAKTCRFHFRTEFLRVIEYQEFERVRGTQK